MAWKDLRDVSWILPPESFTQRRLVQQAFLAAGEMPPEPSIETVNMPAMMRLAEAGLGLTAVPRYAARRELGTGALRAVRTDPPLDPVPIGFVYRRTSRRRELLKVLSSGIGVVLNEPPRS